MEMLEPEQETEKSNHMSAPDAKAAEADRRPRTFQISCRKTAAHALTIVRDGVITGEGPTTKGRMHFSRALDADDAAWCARILTATRGRASAGQPRRSRSAVRDQRCRRRAQRRRPFRRSAGQGGRPSRRLRVRPAGAAAHRRAVAGHRDRELGARPGHRASTPKCWNGSRARCAASRRSNRTLMAMVATIVGAAALPLGATAERVRHRDVSSVDYHADVRRRGYFPAVFCLPVSASSPTRAAGKPAASK